MKVEPTDYTKKTFLEFLKKYGVSGDIINKFKEVPEKININGEIYELKISIRWYDEGRTYYEFELNYYCNKIMEFLFGFKVNTDVEVSINYLITQLKKRKLI